MDRRLDQTVRAWTGQLSEGRAGPRKVSWVVSGHNGENLIRAEGKTAREAWWRAVEQARAGGMMGYPAGR